jgi:hypothetical protein
METFKNYALWIIVIVSTFFTFPLRAQDAKQSYLTVTTMHRNTSNPDLKREEWQKIEKEYFDKVTNKNPLIQHSNLLTHYFTEDNTEIILAQVYESWDAIDKAWEKNAELIKAAWPDEKARKAFFEKKNSFYDGNKHSDEIYAVLPDRKEISKTPDKQMIYYIRKSKSEYPKDGSEEEFKALNKEFLDNVTYKNDILKAYYTYQHAWGSVGSEFVEVYVVDQLGDLEKSWDKDDELAKAHWKDEAKLKDFGKKYGKYFSPTHGDYIYRNEVGLQK